MNDAAPALLTALEQSGLGLAIRQSVWIYPAANVTHVVALAMLAGAVAVMDFRLLGAFGATRPADVIVPARRLAILALLVQMGSGLVLFVAEASHVALNPVFQLKMALLALALVNALLVARVPVSELRAMSAYTAFRLRVRLAALASLLLWLAIAGLGRLIAYF